MGSKKILPPYHAMDPTGAQQPVAVSSTNSYLSEPINVKNTDSIGLQLIWTGTPTGTFTIYHSPDGGLYDSITLSPVITQPAGSGGHWSVVLQGEPHQWVMVGYVNASGSGTVDVIVTAKDWN